MAPRVTVQRTKFCFVGHSFHQRTRSSEFFVTLLREIGEVTEFYASPDAHELDDDELIEQLATSRFDCYVFWQSDFIAERLHGLDLGRFVVVPMYDGVLGRSPRFWQQFVDTQFISFSRAHHEELQALKCRSSYFQFWPEPREIVHERDYLKRDGFFWERRPDTPINIELVKRLGRGLNLSELHLHAAPDYKALRLERRTAHHMRRNSDELKFSVSEWFPERRDFDTAAGRPLFYFAPRQYEGIGMAVLEAMGRGQIVVAPDNATMNEYVTHKVTGILYQVETPDQDFDLNTEELGRISRAAYHRVLLGRERWINDVTRLKSILLDDGQRWSSSDYSSHFLNKIRANASDRVFGDQDGLHAKARPGIGQAQSPTPIGDVR